MEAQNHLQHWPEGGTDVATTAVVTNQLSGGNQHMELQLSPVHNIPDDVTNAEEDLQNIGNAMSQQIEMPQKIVPNEQVYQQHLKEESKKEESLAEKKSKSSSLSEFVYNPDPDFLNRINANIRQNNENGAGQIPIR